MKKENEKLQKATNKHTKGVSGGEIDLNPLTGKWDVYDDITHERVAHDMTEQDARYVDFLYNRQDEIERMANTPQRK